MNSGATWTRAAAPAASGVDTLTVHPRFPRTLYAVTRDGDLFRSRDFARTWTPLGPPVDVEAFALHAGPGPELSYLGAVPGHWRRSSGPAAVPCYSPPTDSLLFIYPERAGGETRA